MNIKISSLIFWLFYLYIFTEIAVINLILIFIVKYILKHKEHFKLSKTSEFIESENENYAYSEVTELAKVKEDLRIAKLKKEIEETRIQLYNVNEWIEEGQA